ncbi:hypothetical protein IC582_002169 [Cucumis melo]
MDDYSKYIWIYPLKQKSAAVDAFQHFITYVKNQFNKTLKIFQSDNWGEYMKIQKLCLTMGINCRFSCPYTSAQNGRIERKHRHVVESGLTLLAQASISLNYWWEAFLTAVILINGMPTPTLQGMSPIEILFARKLNFSELKVFGCACFSCLRPYQSNKFEQHSEKCVFLGPSPVHKRVSACQKTGRIFVSRHMRFNESEFPFSKLFPMTELTQPTNIQPMSSPFLSIPSHNQWIFSPHQPQCYPSPSLDPLQPTPTLSNSTNSIPQNPVPPTDNNLHTISPPQSTSLDQSSSFVSIYQSTSIEASLPRPPFLVLPSYSQCFS